MFTAALGESLGVPRRVSPPRTFHRTLQAPGPDAPAGANFDNYRPTHRHARRLARSLERRIEAPASLPSPQRVDSPYRVLVAAHGGSTPRVSVTRCLVTAHSAAFADACQRNQYRVRLQLAASKLLYNHLLEQMTQKTCCGLSTQVRKLNAD